MKRQKIHSFSETELHQQQLKQLILGEKMSSNLAISDFDKVQAAASYIKKEVNAAGVIEKAVAIVLGSGLGNFGDHLKSMNNFCSIPYTKIPHFPASTVEGHAGNMLYAHDGKQHIFAMQGRFHCYEGYTPQQVVLPLRSLMALGVKTIILTNASGGINEHFDAGDLMLIEDHINLMGTSPLFGPNDSRFGPRFVDMTESYNLKLRNVALQVAQEKNILLRKGVYLGLPGPTYETPAEVRMLRTLGADAVGMSTVFEAIAAQHSGAKTLGISCVTNKAAGLSKGALSHEDVKDTAQKAAAQFGELLLGILSKLN